MLLQLKPLFLGKSNPCLLRRKSISLLWSWAVSVPFPQPVRVTGEATALSGMVMLRATAFFRYEGSCDRCAAPLRREMEAPMEHMLVASLSNEENDEFLLVDNYQLSLEELTEADVILSLPSKNLVPGGLPGGYVPYAVTISTRAVRLPHCGNRVNRRIRGSRLSNSCLIDIYDSDKEVLTMAVPKRKHSKARRDKRRSNVWKMDAPALVKVPAVRRI